MKQSELSAWHAATGQAVCLRWKEGRITALEPAKDSPPANLWLAPPLVDLQVNGFAGVDFQQDHLTSADLLGAVRKLRAHGCTRFLLTLITDEWTRLMARLKHLRSLRDHSAELRQAIAGWHVEGPFLSSEPGYVGAHDPAWTLDAQPKYIRELRQVTGKDPVLLTVSPMRQNAIAAIAMAVRLGMKVSLGHTNAPKRRLQQAVKAGATGFTHLGNGCPQLLDRHDNILWRVFEAPGLTVSLIPDRTHVSPDLFRLVHRVLGPDAIYYVTDAIAAAAAPPGRYRLGPREVEVGEDQVVRLPGSPYYAGSALTPIHGVFRAARMLKCSWRDVWPRFSDAPAKLMGLTNGLEVGGPADFCLLEMAGEKDLVSLKVFVKGETA